MPFLFFDPTILWILPGILLALMAQGYVTSQFAKYSRVMTASGIRAKDAALGILQDAGLSHVKVEPTPGHLSDTTTLGRRCCA